MRIYPIVIALLVTGCSQLSTPVTPSAVDQSGTLYSTHAPAYKPFSSQEFQVHSPGAPQTIFFFWTEAEGALLHGKLASLDSSTTYAEAWVQTKPWSPQTFSFTISKEFCEQTITAQLDVIRFRPDGVTPMGTWRNPTYTGNGKVWTLRGPTCLTPPPEFPPPPPVCVPSPWGPWTPVETSKPTRDTTCQLQTFTRTRVQGCGGVTVETRTECVED